jgi:hypothetical protein
MLLSKINKEILETKPSPRPTFRSCCRNLKSIEELNQLMDVTVNRMEQKSSDFCPNYIREYTLLKRISERRNCYVVFVIFLFEGVASYVETFLNLGVHRVIVIPPTNLLPPQHTAPSLPLSISSKRHSFDFGNFHFH